MEIYFGEFMTEVEFPGPVDVDRCTAEYDRGFLWVSTPKSTPKNIFIQEEE
jgi:HSP20 family molecular chaperone IbpA